MPMSDSYLSQFQKDLQKAGDKMYKYLSDTLANLQLNDGRVAINAENAAFIQSRLLSYAEALKDSGYSNYVDKYVSGFDKIAVERFQDLKDRMGFAFEFDKINKQDLTALAQWEHQALLSVGESNFNAIKSAITINVLSGADFKDITSMIRDTIDSKFVRYANTYAETGLRLYSQEVTKLSVEASGNKPEDFDYEYVGPLDNLTREECTMGLEKGIFTYDEMMQFEDEWGLRWNCRHEFIPVPKAESDEKDLEAAESQEPTENRDAMDRINEAVADTERNQRVLSELKPEKIFKDILDPDEIKAISTYTDGDYVPINTFMRDGIIPENWVAQYNQKEIGNLITKIDTALDKLPNYDGYTSRIIKAKEHYAAGIGVQNKSFDELLKMTIKGDVYTADSFLSTTLINEAETRPSLNSIVYHIIGKSGKEIAGISNYVNEAEVLFRPGTSFRVIDVRVVTREIGKYAEVFMEEL